MSFSPCSSWTSVALYFVCSYGAFEAVVAAFHPRLTCEIFLFFTNSALPKQLSYRAGSLCDTKFAICARHLHCNRVRAVFT